MIEGFIYFGVGELVNPMRTSSNATQTSFLSSIWPFKLDTKFHFECLLHWTVLSIDVNIS